MGCFGLERATLALKEITHDTNQRLEERIASCTERAARLGPKSSAKAAGAGGCAVGLRRWLGLEAVLGQHASYDCAVGRTSEIFATAKQDFNALRNFPTPIG